MGTIKTEFKILKARVVVVVVLVLSIVLFNFGSSLTCPVPSFLRF